ncbi:WD repeat domain phosphoinositide-interacting protein 1-like isoform X1 [Pseudoliparis swirei]|uniref:WD repeat domain phosphoinositide-interacting protein 1-like isoform X1 n=1 Tax=Pseudoliparis swirei TaxID=2059687 RepID=UPI0024BDE36F|nr:WD repeat domain phosphoinositide-interacting protein 1-like isoform X1 [Pseudoliparis swirei]
MAAPMESQESQDAPDGADAQRAFICASFNQDTTSLSVGTKTGYRLFSVTAVDKLDCIHEGVQECVKEVTAEGAPALSEGKHAIRIHGLSLVPLPVECQDVYIVERLFSSSLVVVVSLSMPRRMNVYHFKKGTEICNYSYSNNILSVRLNRQRLVVCLEESVYIHNIKDMKLLKTLLNTPSNPTGLCALSVNHSNSYLAYPGSATIGEITVYDANNLSTLTLIQAHDSPLAALTFNGSGTKLASASERGTVIRVFSIPEGTRLFEFRRGMKRYVSISSLSFSADGQFLCASSNTETVHIFKLEQHSPSLDEESPTWSAYMGKMFTAASTYLPSQVSDMMHQDRAFAMVRLNMVGLKTISALATIQKLPRLLVASSDGCLYIYNVDPQDGGECVQIQKHRLFDSSEKQVEQNSAANPEDVSPQPASQSYAATVALPSTPPSSTTLTGYSEDGGVEKGDVIPEHEFAEGPVCLDDENEFPPFGNQSN